MNNTDLTFPESTFRPAAWVLPDNADDSPYGWYARDSATTGSFDENTDIAKAVEAIPRIWQATATVTGATAFVLDQTFLTADSVGMFITIEGLGTAGAKHVTTIATFVDSTHGTLTAATASNGTGAARIYGAGDTFWNAQKGLIESGGDDCVVSPLDKRDIKPGVVYFGQLLVNYNADEGGAVLDDDIGISMAAWDNTAGQEKIIEGQAFALTAELLSGSGLVSRKYILKVETETGDYYYSDTVTPATVINTPDPEAAIPGVIAIDWPSLAGTRAYHVLRADSVAPTDFYQVDVVTNGATSARDRGGRTGTPITPTARNPKAQSIFKNLGALLKSGRWVNIRFRWRTPSKYDLNATTGKQFIRIELVDADGNPVAVDPRTVLYDKGAVSYTLGDWTASPSDRVTEAPDVSGDPDPNSGDPDPGGRGRGDGGILPF